HITRTWRGRPLTSYEVVVNTIAATTTATGLTVTAIPDAGRYPVGAEVTDAQARQLEDRVIARHGFHGDWNYTLLADPRPAPHPGPAPAPPAPRPAAPPRPPTQATPATPQPPLKKGGVLVGGGAPPPFGGRPGGGGGGGGGWGEGVRCLGECPAGHQLHACLLMPGGRPVPSGWGRPQGPGQVRRHHPLLLCEKAVSGTLPTG